MPKPTKGPRLGGSPAHQKLMLANLAQDLFKHGAVTTTLTKAKRVQPLVDKLVTKARRGDLHARRLAATTIRDKDVLYHLFDEIAPAIDPERKGGYTSIVKLGNRRGDNAPMARISLTTGLKVVKKAVVDTAEKTAAAAAAKEENVEAAASAASASAPSADSASAESASSASAESAPSAASAK